MNLNDQQIPQRPLADQGRRRRRDLLKKTSLVAGVVGGLLFRIDLRDGSLDWSLSEHDPVRDRCHEVAVLSGDGPALPSAALSARETIPLKDPPPPEYSLRADFPLDLEAALDGHLGYEPQWREALTRYRYEQGWQRVWVNGSDKNLFVKVYEFASPRDAHGLQEWAGRFACVFAHDVFEVDGVDGSVGQRIHYYEGRLTEQVSFVRGARRYVIVAGSFSGEVDRSLLSDLTRAIDDLAT